jgi:D-aspartate ligase
MHNQTAVVILQAAHHAGLAIARSLGRLGVPVYCVDDFAWEPVFGSRFCRGRFVPKREDEALTRSLDKLIEIGKHLGCKPILIPTTDSGAIWVAEHAAALQTVFRFQNPDSKLVHVLCDKSRMQELARECELPTALSIVPRSKEDVSLFLDTAKLPVIVKATDAARLRARTGKSKFLINSSQELLELYDHAGDKEQPTFLIQEFVPGEDWMFNGYFDENSRCVFGITGKKLRRFPVHTGVTSLGVCLRNGTVEIQTAEFMKAIGYQGILDIGYRYDRRDGRYKVLDVNPRIGCTFRLFTATNGLDVVRALYLHMTGHSIPSAHAEDGRKWMVEDFDSVSAFRSWRDGTLKLSEWLRSFRGVQETACFALDDPLPFFCLPVTDLCALFQWRRAKRSQSGRAFAVT